MIRFITIKRFDKVQRKTCSDILNTIGAKYYGITFRYFRTKRGYYVTVWDTRRPSFRDKDLSISVRCSTMDEVKFLADNHKDIVKLHTLLHRQNVLREL
jgi:hypothetical protein